jgi:hypothetical protein
MVDCGANSTICFADFLHPAKPECGRNLPSFLSPSLQIEVRLPYVAPDSIAKEVVDSKDIETYLLVVPQNIKSFNDVTGRTVGCVVILDELVVQGERPKDIGEEQDNLFLSLGLSWRFRKVRRDPDDFAVSFVNLVRNTRVVGKFVNFNVDALSSGCSLVLDTLDTALADRPGEEW